MTTDTTTTDQRNPKPSEATKPEPCPECERYRGYGWGPSHRGSSLCTSGSLASGGTRAHCSCRACF